MKYFVLFSFMFSSLVTGTVYAQKLKDSEKYNQLNFECRLAAKEVNGLKQCTSRVENILSDASCQQKEVKCRGVKNKNLYDGQTKHYDQNEDQVYKCSAYSHVCSNAPKRRGLENKMMEYCPQQTHGVINNDIRIQAVIFCKKGTYAEAHKDDQPVQNQKLQPSTKEVHTNN